MARWNVRERQKLIDGYLNATGRNMFVPREFLDWLRGEPDHPVFGVFFGKSEAELAQAMREQMVRQWVSGLRITVQEDAPKSAKVAVVVREMPAMVSVRAGRKAGGGYTPTDPRDPDVMAELRAQAALALDSWLERFGGVAGAAGVDVSPIREIAAALSGGVAKAA